MAQSTFSIAASADDTNLFRTGAAYPPVTTDGGNQTTNIWLVPQKILDAGTYKTEVEFIKFDTSSLLDTATVTSASLQLYMGSIGNADARSINFEWYTWTTPAHPTDWAETVGTTAAVITIASLIVGVNTIALSNAPANVSLTGNTGIRFGVSGGQPTGLNEVYFAAFDHSTEQEPRLVVNYDEVGATSLRVVSSGLRW